jgi:hypothetical protein
MASMDCADDVAAGGADEAEEAAWEVVRAVVVGLEGELRP